MIVDSKINRGYVLVNNEFLQIVAETSHSVNIDSRCNQLEQNKSELGLSI